MSMVQYVRGEKATYIYTPTHTYWVYHARGYSQFGWESRLQQDRDRGHVSNVPDTLVNMLFGLPDRLRK